MTEKKRVAKATLRAMHATTILDVITMLESITAAKAYQAAERAKVAQACGIRFTSDDRVIVAPHLQACPRCGFVASARQDGRAVRALAAHLVTSHRDEFGVPPEAA